MAWQDLGVAFDGGLEHSTEGDHADNLLDAAGEGLFEPEDESALKDTSRYEPDIVGDPDAMAAWHLQEGPNSCAIACQEFILDEFTGVDHSEDDLRKTAEEHGWYTADGGTPMLDTGKLLEHHGIDTDMYRDATVSQIEQALAAGDGVIVGIDSSEIWNLGFDPDGPLTDYVGIPGQGAEHAIEVIGVDYSDPNHPTVIVNDPGAPDGRGEHIPMDVFLDGWADSGNFMLVAHRPRTHKLSEPLMTNDFDIDADHYEDLPVDLEDNTDSDDDSTGDGPGTVFDSDDAPHETDAEQDRVAELQDVRFGTSWTVDGTTESGNPVEWSTSYNGYYDEVTGEKVEPK